MQQKYTGSRVITKYDIFMYTVQKNKQTKTQQTIHNCQSLVEQIKKRKIYNKILKNTQLNNSNNNKII